MRGSKRLHMARLRDVSSWFLLLLVAIGRLWKLSCGMGLVGAIDRVASSRPWTFDMTLSVSFARVDIVGLLMRMRLFALTSAGFSRSWTRLVRAMVRAWTWVRRMRSWLRASVAEGIGRLLLPPRAVCWHILIRMGWRLARWVLAVHRQVCRRINRSRWLLGIRCGRWVWTMQLSSWRISGRPWASGLMELTVINVGLIVRFALSRV